MGDATQEEFGQCRFCNARTDLLVSIYSGEGIQLELESKISKHLPIQISSTDDLPQGACYPCVQLLLSWDSFVELCIENDEKLRSHAIPTVKFELELMEDDNLVFSESDNEPLIKKRRKLSELEANHNEKKKFKCRVCSKDFVSKQGLKNHTKECKSKEYFCEICNQKYKSLANLKRHKEREHDNDPIPCGVCNSAISKGQMYRHLKVSHSIINVAERTARFKCRHCELQFKSKYLRNDHVKQVHETETVKCHACDFEGFRHVVKRHSRSVHAPKRFPCSLCKYSFKTLHLLKLHMTAHSDLRSYTCDVCGMSFKRLNNVRDHMKCHQQKSNQCQICGNFFARKRYLAIHEKTIHNFYADGSAPEEKGFECSVCGAKLKWKKNLMAHMRIHSGEKPYSCKICGQAFVCHGSLRTHMSKHDVASAEQPPSLEGIQQHYSLIPILTIR